LSGTFTKAFDRVGFPANYVSSLASMWALPLITHYSLDIDDDVHDASRRRCPCLAL